jgi:hypothetical protein
MTATGSRLPTGGAIGDTYEFYSSFEVESSAGLDRAIDYAEVRLQFNGP